MNNVVNMVNYYLLHKNADDSVIEYIKEKISKSNINELIVIQIELLYTDPSDKLVSTLVKFINEKINDILNYISLDELINLISNLKININNKEEEILNLKNTNDYKFKTIKTKDLNNDNKFDNEDSVIASSYINEIENNNFIINKLNSEINSIKIWLKNLINYPQVYIEAYLTQTIGYWYPNIEYWATGGESSSIFDTVDVYSDSITPEGFNKIIDITSSRRLPFCNLIWSVGTTTFILIISSFIFVYKNKGKYLLCYIPLYLLLFTILISTPVF